MLFGDSQVSMRITKSENINFANHQKQNRKVIAIVVGMNEYECVRT